MSEFIEVISKQSIEQIDLLNTKLSKTVINVERISKEFSQIVLPSDLKKVIQDITVNTQQSNQAVKEAVNIQKKYNAALNARKLSESELGREIVRVRQETAKNNRETRNATTEYGKIVNKMNAAAKTVQNLTAKQQLHNNLTKKEQVELRKSQREFDKYSLAVRKADAAIGRFNRNVGNYTKGVAGLVRGVRLLASAFGFTGAVFILADALRDASRRVIEFDATMQNIAGILRTTREELADVEGVIRAVAASSVRTTNDIAKLAESLFTLGKSPEEVKNLLKPVTDLSIGLNAAADEAGEFLVQMLNTFQASTAEAGVYADTIATIRTSTSLDFQKMRDSFQFLAPISKVLNKDLAFTGAIVGILADNGIKAERAGRLLGTAQQKLAKEGLTLNDALAEINKSLDSGADEIDTLALASDLLGKQASGLGIILAQNTDIIERNAQAIRDNTGALDDLVNSQLESLDAQLSILNSAWENLILTIEDGDNIVSKFIKGGIKQLILAFTTVSLILNDATGFYVKFFERAAEADTVLGRITNTLITLNPFWEKSKKVIQEDTEARKKNAEEIDKQIAAFIKLNGSLAPFNKGQKEVTEQFGIFANVLLKTSKPLRTYQDVLDDIDEQNDLLKQSTKEEAGAILDRIAVLEKERKAWERSNKTRKKTEKIIKGSIRDFEKQIETLRKNQISTSKSSEEYAEFEHQIQMLSNTVRQLKGDFEQVDGITLEGALNFLGDISEQEEDIADYIEILKELIRLKVKEANGDLDKIEVLLDKDLTIDQLEELYGEILDLDKAFAAQRTAIMADLAQEITNTVSAGLEAVFELELQKYDQRLADNQDFYDNLLDNEELTQEERAQIEEKRNQEQADIREKQAEIENRAFIVSQGVKLAELAIDTAQKVAAIKAQAALLLANPVTAAFASTALAQIPLVIGSAAIAGGVIAAQTIPAFREGVRDFSGGTALLNDAPGSNYKEIVRTPDGKLHRPQGRNVLMNLPKGSDVYTAKESIAFDNNLDMLLANNGIIPMRDKLSNNIVIETNNGISREEMEMIMNKTLAKMSNNTMVLDKSGFETYSSNAYGKKKNLNNRVSFKSKKV